MEQLGLFDFVVPKAAEPPAPAIIESVDASPGDLVLPGQIELFGAWNLAVTRVRGAIADGRLDDAALELGDLLHRAKDHALARSRARVDDLRARLRALAALEPAAHAAGLLALARSIDDSEEPWIELRRTWTRAAAGEAARALGDGGSLEGRPPAYWWMQAGDHAEARSSLVRALASRRSAGLLFLLADASVALSDPAAPALYLEADLLNPFDPARTDVRDPQVAELARVARYEIEIDDEPLAWCAPAGIVVGVYPRARLPHVDLAGSSAREPLARARAFVEALWAAEASRAEPVARIEARRSMKSLCEPLFAAYMERLGGRPR